MKHDPKFTICQGDYFGPNRALNNSSLTITIEGTSFTSGLVSKQKSIVTVSTSFENIIREVTTLYDKVTDDRLLVHDSCFSTGYIERAIFDFIHQLGVPDANSPEQVRQDDEREQEESKANARRTLFKEYAAAKKQGDVKEMCRAAESLLFTGYVGVLGTDEYALWNKARIEACDMGGGAP